MDKPLFKKTNLEYVVDYDYDRTECVCDNDYCRCTQIINTRIDDIHVNKVVEALYHKHGKTDACIDSYCFDRICYAFRVYDKHLYEVETCWGYYGEEIDGVWFDNEEKIFNAYQEILALDTDIEKIKYCLNLEYGYLTDSVNSATSATVVEIVPNNISIPQTSYFRKLRNDVLEEYNNRTLPIAVCLKDEDNYRLVDGYHRFVANKDKETVRIVVIE